jgi:hypothetical protein
VISARCEHREILCARIAYLAVYDGRSASPLDLHMKRLLILLLALALTINAHARCVYSPPIHAEVLVDSCEPVTFGASAAASAYFGSDSHLYKPGSTLTGTFLAVTVKTSDTWPKGERRSLFVAAPDESVCPKVIPSTLKVITTDFCCDYLPLGEGCLVPASVTRVTIVP